MKPIMIWMLLCLFFVLGPIKIDSAVLSQEHFNQANQLYEQEKYSEALQIYLAQAKVGAHWKVFYNIGNCYFKLNQPVKAKIFYLRAQRYDPFETAIQKNIEIVNKLLKDKIKPVKLDFLTRVLIKMESVVSLNFISILLFAMIIVFNGFLFALMKKGKSRFLLYGISFSLILVLLLSVYHIYRVNKYNRREVAVITKSNTQLLSGPGENNTVLFKVNPGLKVKIIDQSENKDWLQISASSEIAGWVKIENLERI